MMKKNIYKRRLLKNKQPVIRKQTKYLLLKHRLSKIKKLSKETRKRKEKRRKKRKTRVKKIQRMLTNQKNLKRN